MSDMGDESVIKAADNAWRERVAESDEPPSTTYSEFVLAFVLGATWQMNR